MTGNIPWLKQTNLLFLGMRVVYNLNEAIGSRVLSVHVLCTKCQVPVYNDLDNEEEYNFLTNQYIVDGGNAYDMSDALQITPSVGKWSQV